MPLYRLWGASRDSVVAYASTAELGTPADRAELAARYRDEGFRAMKLRFHNQEVTDDFALLGKLMTRFPNDASLYYYRGRAYLAAKKVPEAKADLEKFVSMALPDARELPDAKKILEQMKDVK